ncbi:MAG: hypothetical protein AAFU55_14635 [Pseudomonadota bacterium]
MGDETVTDHAGDPTYHRNAVLGRMGFVEFVFGGLLACLIGYFAGNAVGLPPVGTGVTFAALTAGVLAALRMRAARRDQAERAARQNAEYERRWNAGKPK